MTPPESGKCGCGKFADRLDILEFDGNEVSEPMDYTPMVSRKRYHELHDSRAHWIRCFNRLEKAVTNHITQRCIDSDDLAHAHKAVLRDLGPRTGENQ